MKELRTSLDWDEIHDEIRRLGKMMPEFSADFYKVTIRIRTLVTELGNLEVINRQQKTHSSKDACKKKAKQINEELKLIEKIHLMRILSY
jgi:uncharacterized coiled-coil DUF342 family protein